MANWQVLIESRVAKGLLLAAVISAGATSLKDLSKPAIVPKHNASPTCLKTSDCGICFCNLDLGGICMTEPLPRARLINNACRRRCWKIPLVEADGISSSVALGSTLVASREVLRVSD